MMGRPFRGRPFLSFRVVHNQPHGLLSDGAST
jgi:hypothetical protein